jgi:penicillin-binding protein 2D
MFQSIKRKLIFASSILLLFVVLFVSSLFYIKSRKPPEIHDLATIEFYSLDGVKFFELNNDKAQSYVPLSQISPHMIDAIISVEDQHFYEHSGFDYKRIVKSLMDNLASMSKKYGASTLTQQYARNLYLNHEKTYSRKLKEAYYTILLESNFSKDEIIEGYLNTIYFGHGIYGVNDASLYYFNKPVSDITIAQAAILASIPKAPTYYSPIANFEANKERKEIVLSLMLKTESITQDQYDEAINEEVHIIGRHPQSINNIAPYYQDVIVNELEKLNLVKDDFYKGIKVYTTLDTRLNDIINQALITNYSAQSSIEAAVYAIDPETGYVKAVVGGRNYETSQYNRATISMRHPGSTIKPFLYYSALEYGFTPTTTFRSEATTFYINNGTQQYAPSNFSNLYANKDITMAYALATSDNIYAVKTHLYLGEENLIKTARRFGITSPMEPNPSLALGAADVRLSELTTAYAHFASMGKEVKPVYITKVTDINDQLIYEHQKKSEQVFDPSLSFVMTSMLTGMFDTKMNDYASVTGLSIAYRLSHQYAGKSGSTDYDNLMIGYNPHLVVGVWTGYDDQITLTDYAEKVASKRVWADIMENYFAGVTYNWYQQPKNVVGILVDPITGESTNDNRYKKFIYFVKGTQPYQRF